MKDKFILVRRPPEPDTGGKSCVVRVRPDTYSTITEWAALTRKSMSEIVTDAIAFAAAHAEIVDE